MPETHTDLADLAARLERLECSNRRWRSLMLRHLAAIALLALLASISAAQSLPSGDQATAGTYLRLCQSEPMCLVPTDNIWTFIELDTRSGLVAEVQYAMQPDGRYAIAIPGGDFLIGDDNKRLAETLCTLSATSDPANRTKHEGADGSPTAACVAEVEARLLPHVGRFVLYPTHNIFNFLLLDRDTGDVWQVQWGKDRSIWHLNAVAGTTPSN